MDRDYTISNKLIVITVFAIVALNILWVKSVLNVFVLIPQVCYVFILLLQGKRALALYWHLIFIMTSLNTTVSGALLDDANTRVYNYASFKLFGPVSLSYLITILFAILGYGKKPDYTGVDVKPFLKTIKVFVYFGCAGDILGIIGLLGADYRLASFISYNIYLWMTVLMMYALYKNGSTRLVLRVYKTSTAIIAAAVLASATTFFMGVTTGYGGISGLPQLAELTYYSSLLLIGLLYYKKPLFYLIAAVFYFYLSSKNIIGKQIIVLVIALAIILYQILINRNYIKHHLMRTYVVRISIVCGVLVFISTAVLSDNKNLTFHKIYQVTSLFGSGDEVAASPATRIAETANFLENNKKNPLALIFGKGYGSYITDDLQLFYGKNLENGGFSHDQIMSGRYSQLHDTFASVPLLNGFLGLGLLFYLVFMHMRRFKYNFLVFVTVPWLLFTFYFNTQYSFTGIFFLYGSLMKFDYNKPFKFQ